MTSSSYHALEADDDISYSREVQPVKLDAYFVSEEFSEEQVFAQAVAVTDDAPAAHTLWEPETSEYENVKKYPVFSFLLGVSSASCFIAFMAQGDDHHQGLLIAGIVLYIAYLIEALCVSSSMRFLCNMEASSIEDSEHVAFRNMRMSKPEFHMHISCFHFETRTRMASETYQEDGETKTRTVIETYEEKVITHQASDVKRYASWTDLSGPGPVLQPGFALLKVHVKKAVEFEDADTETSFQQQASAFLLGNMYRDRYFDFHETIDIDHFRLNILLYSNGNVPFHVSPYMYLISTICFASWVHRVFLEKLSMDVTWTLQSKISIRQHDYSIAEGIPAASN